MRVIILGAGTAIPAPRRSPAGILVRIGREQVLLDAGPGSAAKVHRAGGSLWELDRIFLTHYHVDHCLDLVAILFAIRIARPSRRRRTLTVYGPRGLRQWYQRLNVAFQKWLTPRGYRLVLRELSHATLSLPGYTLVARPMRHSAPALGYRLIERPGGRSLAYSGDTDTCPEVIALGQAADVFILECSVPDGQKVAGHLTPSDCGRIAQAAGCRRLVLTHRYPTLDGSDIRGRVRQHYQGPLTIARDGTVFTLDACAQF